MTFVALFVAIAFIPVPGFFEAQIRAKTNQVRRELRDLATDALAPNSAPETVSSEETDVAAKDRGGDATAGNFGDASDDRHPAGRRLLIDPFRGGGLPYQVWRNADRTAALLWSVGPDGASDIDPASLRPDITAAALHALLPRGSWLYDPTNGLQSAGDIALMVHGRHPSGLGARDR